MTSIKKLPMMPIAHSTTWLVTLAEQTLGYTTIIQYFMDTNHPIISGHFPPSNLISKMIKAAIIKVILQLLPWPARPWPFPSLSYTIKGSLETP
jgi:hypothetical protein